MERLGEHLQDCRSARQEYVVSTWSRFLLTVADGMQQVICVSTAKVPIVKMYDPELRLHCDMNVNNTLALENTRMIKTYVQIDPRVRPLAMIIKHWTKRRIVNDAGRISSSCLPRALTHSSIRRHPQLIYLDMHDYQLPSEPRATYSTVAPPEAAHDEHTGIRAMRL